MKWLRAVVAVFLLPALLLTKPAQQNQQPVVRVRLFSVRQPATVRITDDSSAAVDVRWVGQQLIVNGKPAVLPFRLRGPRLVSAAGEESVRVEGDLDFSARSGKLVVVAGFDRERYVTAVVLGEAAVFRSLEALKAMAVAARTYAAHFNGRHKDEGFDLCDSTHCQSFSGAPPPERVRRAAEMTAGETIRYDGEPVPAYYHRDCGGVTEGKAPFLPQVHDAFCVSASAHRWTTELTRSELQTVLQMPKADTFVVTSRTPSGRALRVRVEGSRTVTFEAEAFRLAVGRALGWNRIRSDLYEVRRSAAGFVFEGHGSGHGIGLCQDGAAAMGEMGRTYREILAFYYPNTIVETGASPARGISWTRVSSERADFETARASRDPGLAAIADRLIGGLEGATGFRFAVRPLIRIYPTIVAFRDETGEPGWVAASTRGRVIRMQPAEPLRDRGVLESTLRHELAHVLVDSRAISALPVWFREGIVLWLTEPRGAPASTSIDLEALSRELERPQSEQELRRSYQIALGTLERLVRANGRETVLSWIERGVPRNVK